MQQRFARSVFLALTLAAAGCGGGSDTPTAPANQPVVQTGTGTIGPGGASEWLFTAPRAGTAQIALSWTGTGNMDLWLTDPTCNVHPLGNCDIFARSQTMSANPEIVTRTVAAGERFKIWSANQPITESQLNELSFKVTVTIN